MEITCCPPSLFKSILALTCLPLIQSTLFCPYHSAYRCTVFVCITVCITALSMYFCFEPEMLCDHFDGFINVFMSFPRSALRPFRCWDCTLNNKLIDWLIVSRPWLFSLFPQEVPRCISCIVFLICQWSQWACPRMLCWLHEQSTRLQEQLRSLLSAPVVWRKEMIERLPPVFCRSPSGQTVLFTQLWNYLDH